MVIVSFLDGLAILLFLPILDLWATNDVDSSMLFSQYIQVFFIAIGFSLDIQNLVVFICLVLFIKSVFGYGLVMFNNAVRFRLTALFRSEYLLLNLSLLPLETINRSSGEMLNIYTDQSSKAIAAFFNFQRIFVVLIGALVYIVLIAMSSVSIFMLSVGILLPLYYLLSLINNRIAAYSSLSAKKLGDISDLQLQIIAGAEFLYATNRLQIIHDKLSSDVNSLCLIEKRLFSLYGLTQVLREPIIFLIVFSLIAANSFVFSVPVSVSIVSALLLYRVFSFVLQLNSDIQSFLQHEGAVRVIAAEECNFQDAPRYFANKEAVAEMLPGTIKLKDFKLSMGGEFTVIDNASINIPLRQKVAIIGASGVGKSSLLKVLAGILPHDEGGIFLGDTGVEVDTTSSSWRALLGFVTQNVPLFSGPLYENLFLHDIELSKRKLAEIEEVFRQLGLDALLIGGTPILTTEQINKLSGGQRQRLAIAREILSDKPILLFDEPTSALDTVNKHKFIELLEKYAADRTVVVVTHDVSVARSLDRIFCIKNNEISEVRK